jgi:3-oxoacyl-[acyl-carrier-protein] synthase II
MAQMKSRVVITGMGVVSAIGIGAGKVWAALARGNSGIKPISSFDVTHLRCKRAAQVSGFNVRDYVSHRGIGCFNRPTQFVCAAGQLALNEAEIDLSALDKNEMGVALGTAFGCANSMEAFDEECLRDGVRFVDPMSFPNTVTNSPAGYLSILVGAAGLNITISTGLASGLDAVEYATGVLAEGRMRVVLAGGYDELSLASHLELSQAGLLADSCETDDEVSAPMDRKRSGLFLGEGAGMLVLERLEDALARKAPIIAELGGLGTAFCSDASRVVESESQAMTSALTAAGLKAHDIGCISASASGSIEGDRAERLSIEQTFGDAASVIPVTAIKSMIGEAGAAAGAIQVIIAALSTRFNAVPPTRGFEAADTGSLLKKISPFEQAVDCNAVLVNSFNGRHNNSSAVVKKFPC